MSSKNNQLPKIKLKNTLKAHVIEQNLFNLITYELKGIPNISEIQHNIELVEYVCNLIENSVKKNNRKSKSRVDKKKVVIRIFQTFFGLDDRQVEILDGQIDYLYQNGQIARLLLSQRLYAIVKNFFLTKIL
jgi:hypothetical protein